MTNRKGPPKCAYCDGTGASWTSRPCDKCDSTGVDREWSEMSMAVYVSCRKTLDKELSKSKSLTITEKIMDEALSVQMHLKDNRVRP